jgi:hypothetical protein
MRRCRPISNTSSHNITSARVVRATSSAPPRTTPDAVKRARTGVYEKPKSGRDFTLSLIDDAAALAEVDWAYLSLPVTSVKGYDKYVESVAASLQLPPYAVVTRIYTVPDEKSQFRILTELVDKATDEVLPTLAARHDAAASLMEVGYQPPDREATEKPGKAQIAGLRKEGAR